MQTTFAEVRCPCISSSIGALKYRFPGRGGDRGEGSIETLLCVQVACMRSNTDSISRRRRFTGEMESAPPASGDLPLATLDGIEKEEEALCISDVFSDRESTRRKGRMDFKEATKQLRANFEETIRRRDKAVSRLPPSLLPAAETVGDGYL